jgi:hypothetical protein
LSVAYPIELRGPGGVTVPTGFAMLLERKTADRYLGFPTGALHPLTRVLPRQPVTMLLRVRVDCRHAAAQERWAKGLPAILIRLDGIPGLASFTFDSGLGGFSSPEPRRPSAPGAQRSQPHRLRRS